MGNKFANCFICFEDPTKIKLHDTKLGLLLEKSNDLLNSRRKCSDEFSSEHNIFKLRLIKKLKKQSAENYIRQKDYIEIYDNILEEWHNFKHVYLMLIMKFENSLKNSHYDLNGLSNSVSILENEHPDYMNIIVRYEKLAKTIIDELKINHNMINEIIEKFKIVFFSKYDFSIITKKFLKKIDKSQFSKIKSDIFQDLKFYLIKPLYKIIKFLFKLILGTDALEKLETSNKNKLKMIIYDLTHKIIFKVNYKIYEIIIMFLNEATKSQKNQLKSQQLSLKKYKFIESFDVDKEFSFHTTTRNSTGYYGGELYLNAIEKVKSIEKKLTPFRKLDTVSTIHHNLWGSILKSHENNDSKEFMELRAKLDADNLISLYSYVIFNSKNCYLHREISFIEEFLEEKILNNYDYLYYFEMFKSALEYITNHISDN